MTDQLLDDLSRMMSAMADLPPTPRCIIASHQVPYGRAPRMWNTRGDLIVYANRGEIAGLPRAKAKPAPCPSMLPFGIPVHYE